MRARSPTRIWPRSSTVGTGTTMANSSQLALVVIGHGEHGLVVVAGEHHLGGAVEELGVGLGDVEPAERQGGRGPRDGERGGDGSGDDDLHGALVSWASPAPAAGCHW